MRWRSLLALQTLVHSAVILPAAADLRAQEAQNAQALTLAEALDLAEKRSEAVGIARAEGFGPAPRASASRHAAPTFRSSAARRRTSEPWKVNSRR